MKKVLIFLCVIFLMATSTQSAECIGGTLVTSHKASDEGCTSATCNEHTFCKSDRNMNWGSAFTWCQANGRRLARFSVMCPGIQTSPNDVAGACPNLTGVNTNRADYGAWSSVPYQTAYALIVSLSSGAVFAYYRHSGSYNAFCE